MVAEVTDSELEERLLEWIFDRRDKGFRVSRKLIQLKSEGVPEREQCNRQW